MIYSYITPYCDAYQHLCYNSIMTLSTELQLSKLQVTLLKSVRNPCPICLLQLDSETQTCARISCTNLRCTFPKESYHYRCVGIKYKAIPEHWSCPICVDLFCNG